MKPPTYDPNEARFWDAVDLKESLVAALDVCNGCRLCFNLCGSFPALFEAADRHGDDTSRFTDGEVQRVVDACFQCKVCYERCPYTPDQGHAYALDFPRLLQRAAAVRVRREGLTFRDRVLADPDLAARFATGPLAPLVNRLLAMPLVRRFLEGAIGISATKSLPTFARTTFASWMQRRRSAPGPAEVGYFATCFADANAPQIAAATVLVLEHQGLRVTSLTGICCGMPKWAVGDMDGAARLAAENVRTLQGIARAGIPIVVQSPTCAMHMKEEFPRLAPTPEAKAVAASVRDLGEYLRDLDHLGRLRRDFVKPIGKVTYHVACHLRAQKIGEPMRQVLTRAGAEVESVRACSGHDGTWSMKAENFASSLRYGAACFEGMSSGAGACAGDCPLAALQIHQATGHEVRHPMELLADAYGLGANVP